MPTPTTPAADPATTPIIIWLACCCALVFAIIVLGGAVRLTGSGLSMVDWHLISGALPPTNAADWQRLFTAYQRHAEFQLLHPDMTPARFRFIFWMEYAHRLLGRVVGVAFALPLALLLWRRRLAPAVAARLLALLLLGGAQGLAGWYMVKSGLAAEPRVSHLRLALHFMLAVVIYAYLLRVLVGLWPARWRLGVVTTDGGMENASGAAVMTNGAVAKTSGAAVTTSGAVAMVVLLVMLLAGVLVAGTHAGFVHNTWPKMSGLWLPDDAFALRPWWRNFSANVVAIQFVHRWWAVVTLAAVGWFAWRLIRGGGDAAAATTDSADANANAITANSTASTNATAATASSPTLGYTILALAAAQTVLGIATLLLRVPTTLGVAHQAGAILLLSAMVIALARQLPPLPRGKRW